MSEAVKDALSRLSLAQESKNSKNSKNCKNNKNSKNGKNSKNSKSGKNSNNSKNRNNSKHRNNSALLETQSSDSCEDSMGFHHAREWTQDSVQVI